MTTTRRRGFGAIRKLPSGRYQAHYLGPDQQRHKAPSTFDTRKDAEAWLAEAQTAISRQDWRRPRERRVKLPTLADYAAKWLAGRRTARGEPLRPRTLSEYRNMLRLYILPTLGASPLDLITAADVAAWHAGLDTGPTAKAHAYALLRAVMATAATDGLIPANPCRVRGGAATRRARAVHPATLPELTTITELMPEQYRAAVLIAAWCGLRFGEIAELRRGDVAISGGAGVLHITRAVVHIDGMPVVGPPKTDAGIRDVSVPPHLVPVLADHLAQHVGRGKDALLFPAPTGGQQRSDSRMLRAFHKARHAAGRDDLTWHGLRHTGATLAAATGATLAELMHRLGHSTPAAAMLYQHATAERDAAIAAALSGFATGGVVELRPRRTSA